MPRAKLVTLKEEYLYELKIYEEITLVYEGISESDVQSKISF